MDLLIMEDDSWRNFKPLTYTRASFDLHDGPGPLIDRIRSRVEHDELHLYVRPELRELEKMRHVDASINEPPSGELVTVVNGLARDVHTLTRVAERLAGREFLLLEGERVVGAVLRTRRLEGVDSPLPLEPLLKRLVGEVEAYSAEEPQLYLYPWQLLEGIPRGIQAAGGPGIDVDGVAVLGERSRVVVGEETEIEPQVVIDTRRGPVVLGRGCRIEAGTKLTGPCFIGRDSVIFGGRIGPDVAAGPCCRLGGEVESSIIIGYSNKRHYGFMGHCLVGEWVNIGAGTSNSNLKNTYGEVRVEIENERVSTGKQFFGAIIGDHARTGIGTMIETGRKIGCFTMLSWRVSRDVPPFIAIDSEGRPYELLLESELRTARRMMERRGVRMPEVYATFIEELFARTASERRDYLSR